MLLRLLVAVSCLVCLMAPGMAQNASALSPVVIVPGILGNQLWAKLNKTYHSHFWCDVQSDWFNIWLSIEELLQPVVECASDNIMLHYDNTTKLYHNQAGVEIKAPGFGETDTVEYLDPSLKTDTTNYFHNMVENLVNNLGYVRGKSIRAAPYDWRFAPAGLMQRGYFDDLQKLIEELYSTNGNRQVTILTHSMGGPTSLYFLTKVVSPEWKATYIKQYITLSAVWGGAAKSARALVSGDNEDIFIDRPIWGRASQRTYQSTVWLLPPPGDLWTKEDILVSHQGKNYSAFDYQQLFKDMDYPIAWDMFLDVKDLTSGFLPPNLTTYCYYGFDVKTPRLFLYSDEFPNENPDVVTSNGDGTVNERSLKVCERWKGQQSSIVYEKPFSGIQHVDMVRDSRIVQAVADILRNS